MEDTEMEISPPPCDITMGCCIEELKEGYSRWSWTVRDNRFNNPIGRVLDGDLDGRASARLSIQEYSRPGIAGSGSGCHNR